jgi:hypothetical protein
VCIKEGNQLSSKASVVLRAAEFVEFSAVFNIAGASLMDIM